MPPKLGVVAADAAPKKPPVAGVVVVACGVPNIFPGVDAWVVPKILPLGLGAAPPKRELGAEVTVLAGAAPKGGGAVVVTLVPNKLPDGVPNVGAGVPTWVPKLGTEAELWAPNPGVAAVVCAPKTGAAVLLKFNPGCVAAVEGEPKTLPVRFDPKLNPEVVVVTAVVVAEPNAVEGAAPKAVEGAAPKAGAVAVPNPEITKAIIQIQNKGLAHKCIACANADIHSSVLFSNLQKLTSLLINIS